MHHLATLRASILVALGSAALAGCGGKTNLEVGEEGGGGVGGSGGAGGEGGSGSVATASAATGSTSTGTSSACVDPEPMLQAGGTPSGFVRCADGSIDRVEPALCEEPFPSGASCAGTEMFLSCTADADCFERPFGRCLSGTYAETGEGFCQCSYGCGSDVDCAGLGFEAICACPAGDGTPSAPTCVPAGCAENAECASGECGFGSRDTGCGVERFAVCRSASDTCRADAQCNGGQCSPIGLDTPFECRTPDCAIGRPMIVEGVARQATITARPDWLVSADPSTLPAADALPPGIARAAAEHWTRVASLEHASIGSFARFSLQLLALGAPPDLLVDAQRAATDEIDHARKAFAIASHFAGRVVGPGPLPEAGAPIATDRASFVRALVEEACVGETIGAAEARTLAEVAGCEALARVHRTIAGDEQRHAELAWRTLAWVLRVDPALAAIALDAMARASERLAPLVEVGSGEGLSAPELGVLSARSIAELRRRTIDEVVVPCMHAALGAAHA
jgi:hypothetical protein